MTAVRPTAHADHHHSDYPLAAASTGKPTPRRLRTYQTITWILAFALFLVTLWSTREARYAIKTVGEDSAPSIVAAQQIKASLADMDSNVANELISKPGQNPEAVKTIDKRRQEVGDTLVTAAKNITYDQERPPIATMVIGFGEYQAWIARARLLHERNDPAMLATYRHATGIVHDTLLPAADMLTKVNFDALTSAYDSQSAMAGFNTLLVMTAGVALLATLIATQLFLTRKMHRLVNPGLLAATVLAALFLLFAVNRLRGSAHHLNVAKKDAFDSVHALWQARAVAYDANGEESRWLLDQPQANLYEQAWLDKTAKIATLPGGQSYDVVATAYANPQSQKLAGFRGFLADELNNITFDGEREAAVATLRAYGVYFGVDGKIRSLENAGRHNEAVALCTGSKPGESDWAYSQFDDALGATLKINADAFDQAWHSGQGSVAGLEVEALIIALAVGGLATLGLRPRLQEYAFT